MKRAEIEQKLQRLAASQPPTEFSEGAMCYSVAMPPTTADYVCPGCGEKTHYTVPEGTFGGIPRLIEWELPRCRRIAGGIEQFGVELDESQFCRRCSPDVEAPELALLVRYGGEPEVHRYEGVTREDLQLVSEFLSGKDKHVGRQGGEMPLKNYIERLEELLDVRLDTEGSKEEEIEE